MFLNKINLPYCLFVFFVVCPHLRSNPLASRVPSRGFVKTALGANGFSCRLQATGYPHQAYFSLPNIYYVICEWVHGSLEKPSSKVGSQSSKR